MNELAVLPGLDTPLLKQEPVSWIVMLVFLITKKYWGQGGKALAGNYLTT